MAQLAASRDSALASQELEMHRFYECWLDAHGSSINVASNVDSLAANDLANRGYRAHSSKDTALSAFAQLAALRLDVKRCMISLLDRDHQYVLAEATRTLSLVDDTRHAAGDQLWLGAAVLNRHDALCGHCVAEQCTASDSDGKTFTTKGMIINDCRHDERFQDREYVKEEAGVRFYAGVPIVTRNGHTIGTYSVFDDRPRDGLNVDELQFMADMSGAVLEHLEWARDRVDRYKGERIVRGLADFIDRSSAAKLPPGEREVDTHDNEATKDDQRTEHTPSDGHKPSTHKTPHSRNVKSDALSSTLDRAAKILRESTLADGVVFFGSSASSPISLPPGHESGDNSVDHSSDSDSNVHTRPCRVLAMSLSGSEGSDLKQDSVISMSALERYFELYPHGKTLHFNGDGAGLSSEDESASESQTPGRHPQHGSASGHLADTGATNGRSSRKSSARMLHTELLKKLPGVKKLIFLPLRDPIEGKWAAGCFLFTASSGRMMDLDDQLTYLRAFGSSIMSEVARSDAQKDDRAKTTFIASMSHELRSPLHGILGSIEFLQDTATDSYQKGLVTSIATCGNTLLQVLDHVLDYAKINRLGRTSMKRRTKGKHLISLPSSSAMDSFNVNAEVDLGILVEEVVEAVCAGHTFKKMHSDQLSDNAGQNLATNLYAEAKALAQSEGSSDPEKALSVLLDISPRLSWCVKTQPGALRRIIMNLLGNSLKHTNHGFVAVSLRAHEDSSNGKINAVFRVCDSGIGISEDFQRNRLFVPFSQEDSFKPGTGLGLSIVKQIVDSLGGSIEVKSVKGQGTEIEVLLSFHPAKAGINAPLDENIGATTKLTRALRLCILDPNQEKQRPRNNHIARLDTTISETCAAWFGMTLTAAENMDEADADVYLYTEPPTVEYLVETHGKERTDEDGKEVPLIIVCMNAQEAIHISTQHIKTLSKLGRIVEVIPQPCGPRKLAKVLSHCLHRVEEASGRSGQLRSAENSAALATRPRARHVGESQSHLPDNDAAKAVRETHTDPKGPRERHEYLEAMPQHVPMSSAVAFPSPPPVDAGNPKLLTMKRTLSSGPGAADSKLHVLLVDDNRINLQLLVMFMKKNKLSYEEAENGLQAFEKYKAACLPGPDSTCVGRSFDFVLMDLTMPVMDGLESTRRIRAFEKENGMKRTTIFALTGLASAQAQTDAEKAGIDVYLAKPVKFDGLKKLLFA